MSISITANKSYSDVTLLKNYQPTTRLEYSQKIDLFNLIAVETFFKIACPETFNPHPPWMIPEKFRPKQVLEEGCRLTLSSGAITKVYTIEESSQPTEKISIASFFQSIKELFSPPPIESKPFTDWRYIIEEFENPEYQKNPEEYIRSKYEKEFDWRIRHPTCLLASNTCARLKMLLDYNERCDLITTIYKRIREGAGLEVASDPVKEKLKESGSDMTKEHLVAIIEPLLSYYGMKLEGVNPKYPFQFGRWFQHFTTIANPTVNSSIFGYSLAQQTVYHLENEVIDDIKHVCGTMVTIPPRVIPSQQYELALRYEGMREIFDLFNEINLIRIVYLFYTKIYRNTLENQLLTSSAYH